MRKGLLLFQLNGGIALGIFLLFLFGAGLSGCGGGNSSVPARPTVCTPPATLNVNIYRATPTPLAMQISTSVPLTNGSPQTVIGSVPNTLTQEQVLAMLEQPQAQQQTSPTLNGDFGNLIHETKSWSDIQTIKLDDVSQAQVVVTFLSPQLIKTVYGNELRNYGYNGLDPQLVLDEIAKRDELIFFVMVITTTNNNLGPASHKIQIPVREMVIVNAEDVIAPPLRDDHSLAQEINSSFEPVFGYLTYPLAMLRGVECSWILNPDYNKKIFITIPHIYVDGVSSGSYMWEIPYLPLFNSGLPPPAETNVPFDSSQMSSSLTPPIPMRSLLVTNGLDENAFWQAYARFLWKQVVLRNY